MIKPTWIDTYISMAMILAERSPDEETKVGCIFTNTKNEIIGTGYNGYPAGIDDLDLPTKRPDKYDYKIIHAEENAIYNTEHKPTNGIAYLTCVPCYSCFIRMYQFGIRTVYYSSLYTPVSAQIKDKYMREDFIIRTGGEYKLIEVKFNEKLIEKVQKKILDYQKNGV